MAGLAAVLVEDEIVQIGVGVVIFPHISSLLFVTHRLVYALGEEKFRRFACAIDFFSEMGYNNPTQSQKGPDMRQ